MKRIDYSTKAKKDLKRYRHDTNKMRQLFDILTLLAQGEPIPVQFKPHVLSGNYKNCMECHVGIDFLLVWVDSEADKIYIVRIGSRAELFGK